MKKSGLHHPHDGLFQAALTHKQVAIDLLKHRLPTAISKRLDFNSLTLERTTFISKRLRKRYSDVIYSANIDGKKGYVYTLIEHQSKEDKQQPLRLMEYTIRLIAQHLKKHSKCEGYPAVIPLVCFAGEDPYKGPKSIAEAFQDPELFIQTLRNTFLTNINTEEEKETLKDKSAALASMLLKHAKIRDFCQLFENKTFIRLLQTSPYQTEALVYIVSQDQHKPDQVLEKIAILGENKKHKVMSYVQRQMKQIRSEGIQQGRYEGAKTEKVKIAKQMLVKGMDIKLVAELTGLSEAEIKDRT